MDWEDLSLADVRRLVATIERASQNPDAVRAIIEQTAAESMSHGRVTLRTLITLLNQLDGATVLPETVLEYLRQLQPPAPLFANDVPPVATPPPPPATFAELIAACQVWIDSIRICEESFPLIDDGTTGPIAELLLENVTGVVALEHLTELGYRPVGMRRGLEYIAQHAEGIKADRKDIAIIGAVAAPVSSPIVFGRHDHLVITTYSIRGRYPGLVYYLVARE